MVGSVVGSIVVGLVEGGVEGANEDVFVTLEGGSEGIDVGTGSVTEDVGLVNVMFVGKIDGVCVGTRLGTPVTLIEELLGRVELGREGLNVGTNVLLSVVLGAKVGGPIVGGVVVGIGGAEVNMRVGHTL